MHVLVSDDRCFLIKETTRVSKPPIAVVIKNKAFTAEATAYFEATAPH